MAAARVHIAIGTAAIRARWAGERLPVRDDEWDEADYLRQRAQAYREAVASVAPSVEVCCATGATGATGAAGAAGAAAALSPEWIAHCPVTGDAVRIAWPADEPDAALQAHVARAVQRVFADAGAWRRSLRPAYFARHRAWRAQVGAPVQH